MEMAAEVVKRRIGVCANGTTEWQLILCHVIEENPYCCIVPKRRSDSAVLIFFSLINLRRWGGRSLLWCCCLYIPGPTSRRGKREAMGPNWTRSKRCFFVLRLWASVKKCFIFTQPPEKKCSLMKCHPKTHHKKAYFIKNKSFCFCVGTFFVPFLIFYNRLRRNTDSVTDNKQIRYSLCSALCCVDAWLKYLVLFHCGFLWCWGFGGVFFPILRLCFLEDEAKILKLSVNTVVGGWKKTAILLFGFIFFPQIWQATLTSRCVYRVAVKYSGCMLVYWTTFD